MLTKRVLLLICMLAVFSVPSARAQEGELPDAEAATEVIESLQGALGDLSTILALPPQQRVNWVLSEAAGRVQNKVIDDAKESVKEAMDNYAAAAFRAKAFENIAVPALKNAAVAGGAVDWTLLEARMASEVDTKVAAYGAAVAGATIVWDSIDAFSEQGAQAGFAKIAGGVYDAVADAYIPGWGWFKLGATMVEALGNYVIGYATDTATEGMLNDLFNMKSDPKAFAQMLRTTDLAGVYARVDDGWELVAYGRLWNGQGTDAGDEAMKQRLKDTLYSIKAGIAHEVAEQQRKDAALQAKFQPYLDVAAQAEAQLKARADKARSDAKPMLDVIRDFQRRVGALQEEKAVEDALHYQALAQSAPGEPLPYTPLDRGGVLAMWTAAYSRILEAPGGSFDAEAFYDEWVEANNAMYQLTESQVLPPDGPGKVEWLAHRDADRQALYSEVALIRAEADQRAAKLAAVISQQTLPLAAQLKEAAAKLENDLAALEREAAENLQLPLTYQRYTQAGFTENWLWGGPFYNDYMGYYTPPAENYAQMAGYLEKVQADRETLAGLNSRRRKLYADFTTLIQSVDTQMNSLIPEGCQVFTNMVASSTETRRSWKLANYYSPSVPLAFEGLPLAVVFVNPEYTTGEFDSAAAIAALQTRMSELQAAYDLAQLQQALQRIHGLLEEKFQPFAVTSAGGHAYSLMGRVNGLLDYRQPIEQTDLALHARKFEAVWLAAQTRLEYLQRHPTLTDVAPLLQHGTNLNSYQTMLAADLDQRQRAPGQAASLLASMQQGLDLWTPIYLEQTPDYYEDALGGLGSMLANGQRDLLRAQSHSSPAYTLMLDDLLAYIPQVTNLIHQAQTEYARITPWYFRTMPEVSFSTNAVQGAIGQTVQLASQASEPGGTFSSPNLPAGLTIDPASGTITGVATQSGSFDVVIRYLAPSGISGRALVHFELTAPVAAAQTLTIRDGWPEMVFHGSPGVNYSLQTLSDFGGDARWVTVQNLTLTNATQSWTDATGTLSTQRFYRIVWVPPVF